MWVLVGGDGFLGAHLRVALAQTSARVVVVRRSEPRTARLSATEMSVSSDALASEEGAALLADASVIVYLATASTPATFPDAPEIDIAANVPPATAFFRRIAQVAPRARVILMSSGGTVYGDVPGSDPIPETAPTSPISSYGLSKVMVEQALAFVSRRTGLSAAVLRVGNPIGVYQRGAGQGIARAMFNAISTGEPLPVYGDGLSMRDYLDADDVAQAIIRVAEADFRPYGVWNIGSGEGRTLRDMLELARTVAGRPVPISNAPARGFDVRSIVLDCRKAEADFGWRAATPISEALAKVWRMVQSAGEGGAAA